MNTTSHTFHSDQKFLSATLFSYDGSIEIRTTMNSREIIMSFGSIAQMENFAKLLLRARKNLTDSYFETKDESFTHHSKKCFMAVRIRYDGRVHVLTATNKFVCEFLNTDNMLSFRSFLLEAFSALKHLSFE